jgi:DNA polymerase epsilon subunit 1
MFTLLSSFMYLPTLQAKDGGYRGACSVHLDCMAWVNRDSYLPQGSRSLKAVAREKLG